ncbi:hypothetical protein ACLOJK_039018 [Asimina triloba]
MERKMLFCWQVDRMGKELGRKGRHGHGRWRLAAGGGADAGRCEGAGWSVEDGAGGVAGSFAPAAGVGGAADARGGWMENELASWIGLLVGRDLAADILDGSDQLIGASPMVGLGGSRWGRRWNIGFLIFM